MADPAVTVCVERLEDYPAIADIHARAFNGGYAEGLIVSFGNTRSSRMGAGMAQSFHPNPFDDCLALIKRGEQMVGRPIWPAEFDV